MKFTEYLMQQNIQLTVAQQNLARRIDLASSDFACVALLTGPHSCKNKMLLTAWLDWRDYLKGLKSGKNSRP